MLIVLIPFFAHSDQSNTSGHKLLILGDSLSAAYNLKQEQGWVSLLQNAWSNNDIHIVNAAISGETSSGGLARLPRLLEQHDPTHMLIELGANDGLRGYSITKMKANLVKMIELGQAHGVQIALQEMQIPPNYGRRYTQMFTQTYHELAEEYQLTVIPFFMQDVALDKSLMQKDGLHPNAKGQPIIAEFMQSQLGTWLAE
ncbi:arylesterase [Alteromonas sp. a30]|uniref:arylesterase n=1 Tax=Alteromonas sp. a30 TaxID=2730917 RepID=UPI0022810EFC|nr:arylesterase [Alteromonas sp. a30]